VQKRRRGYYYLLTVGISLVRFAVRGANLGEILRIWGYIPPRSQQIIIIMASASSKAAFHKTAIEKPAIQSNEIIILLDDDDDDDDDSMATIRSSKTGKILLPLATISSRASLCPQFTLRVLNSSNSYTPTDMDTVKYSQYISRIPSERYRRSVIQLYIILHYTTEGLWWL